MRRLVLFILMLGFFYLGLAQQQKNDLDQVLRLFPGFHIVKLDEFDSDTRAFTQNHFPKDSPGVVRGDFDGNGVVDYALLLKDSKSGSTQVVVALCVPDNRRSVYRLDVSSYAGGVYLRPSRIGSNFSRHSGDLLREGEGLAVMEQKTQTYRRGTGGGLERLELTAKSE